MKKFLFLGLLTLVCAALVTVFLLKRMEKIDPVEMSSAVPSDAILMVERIDYTYLSEQFFPKNRIWVDLVNTSGRARLDSSLQSLLMKISTNEGLHRVLREKGFGLSLHLQGKDQLVPLFYIPYADFMDDDAFGDLLLDFLGDQSLSHQRKYEGEVLNEISGNPELIRGKFAFACVNGVCLISPESMMVEASVRRIHDRDQHVPDEDLQLVQRTAGKYVQANIYMNYERLPQVWKAFLKESAWKEAGLMSRLASWGEMDLDIKEDAVITNGMVVPGNSADNFLRCFQGQSPVKMELQERVPSGIAWFTHLGISDVQLFREQLELLLREQGSWESFAARNTAVLDTYGVDPLEDMVRILDDEILRIALEDESAGSDAEIVLIETKSRSETQEVVMRWLQQYLSVHTFDMDSYRSVYRLDKQTRFDIYKMPPFFEKESMCGLLFNSYFTIYENCLIFGPSVEALSRVLYKNVLHKTFVSDPAFKGMTDYFSTRSNLSFFIRPHAALDYMDADLNKRSQDFRSATELFLRRIPGIVVQYSAEGEMLYQSLSYRYAAQIREKALTVWESLLDSTVVVKPALVTNHNTREKEIFVQDANNKIYLVNSTGRILWEKKIDGRLMGKVHQVDFYKNGKLQYLFSTSGKLHLVDRNGNYVERYPISLRKEASSPLALFDYDRSRDYRIFIALSDRRMDVYDIEGNLVTGWKFGKSESMVTRAPQHFRIGDRDYIVFADENRAYFLDRRGKERVKAGSRIVFSENNDFALDMNIRQNRPRWISTDTTGNVIAIYTDGSVSSLMERDSPSDHFFLMQDLDHDGVPEYLFAEGDELNVFGQDGRRHFSFKVRDRIGQMPDIYKFSSSDVKIGITDHERKKIYLLNGDGSLYDGFPLEGSTRFSIGYFAGSDSRFNLIVGSTNNFLYNYSIE